MDKLILTVDTKSWNGNYHTNSYECNDQRHADNLLAKIERGRSEVIGYHVRPADATHYLPTKTGYIQMFYRVITVKWNDGTSNDVLYYYSECGSGWMPSSESLSYINEKLIKL